MRPSITTMTPRFRALGEAATRIAESRLCGPSGPTPVGGRWAPTTTTGRSDLTVRWRKKAVCSREAVPWVTTTPATSGRPTKTSLIL